MLSCPGAWVRQSAKALLGREDLLQTGLHNPWFNLLLWFAFCCLWLALPAQCHLSSRWETYNRCWTKFNISSQSWRQMCFKGSTGMPFPTHRYALWLQCLLESQHGLPRVSSQAVFNLIVHSDLVYPIYPAFSPISSTPRTVKMSCVLASPVTDCFAKSEEMSLELLCPTFKGETGCPTRRQPCMFDRLGKVQAVLSISLSAAGSRINRPQSETVWRCWELNVRPRVLILTS